MDKQTTKAKKEVEVGGIYYHYKNPDKFYVVESVGFLENTEELCVIYRALYGKGIVWVRTLDNFLEKANGKIRFTKIKN
ncbi:hypothetical protein A2803_03145 [Candidatus Woesebacteria bacterium RIFCSPHIGHO2_01_FULL_44_21]|uniref:DUF1653 domain-containing protein n=1 Tax=Candidatus Woesebacteria bacterium RIFCSPHIGHO2_01_FULL_44_21 TaxID=1802503 RepID=A0A1F7Z0P4_9BACT|nr:MAG: hypothetical protein A2803_03145 [Candidatus Woesebacteria bacterium RIFCSPHIGHO2_01_FULL_44_21]OGM69182.1 MAG: hypothetical protein A2897_05100 [Candidatus Woesebacteria bacterium RIFCSPLOWO2_01_FULL_44_24b]